MGGKRALKTLEDIVLEDLDDNNRGKNGVAQEMEKSRFIRPLKQTQTNEDGKNSNQTLHYLNQVRNQLEDTNLIIQVTGNWNSSPKESLIKIGPLFEMLQKVKLENEKIWVDSILAKLNYLIIEGLEDHYVSYKTQMISKKDTAAHFSQVSKSDIAAILNEISPDKKLEDWDLSIEDMRKYLTEPDSFEQHHRYNNFGADDIIQSSGEYTSSYEDYIYSSSMEQLYVASSPK